MDRLQEMEGHLCGQVINKEVCGYQNGLEQNRTENKAVNPTDVKSSAK